MRPETCKLCCLPQPGLGQFHMRLLGNPGDPAADPPVPPTVKMTYEKLQGWLSQELGLKVHKSTISIHLNEHLVPLLMVAQPIPDPDPPVAEADEPALVEQEAEQAEVVTGLLRKRKGRPVLLIQRPEVALLDDMLLDLHRTYRMINRQVRDRKTLSYAEGAFLTGAVRVVTQATATRRAVLSGRTDGTGGNEGALALLRRMAGNAPPPFLDGDQPDGDDDDQDEVEDEGAEGLPRDHEGVPDDGFDRPIIEAVVAVQEDVDVVGDSDAAPESSERGPAVAESAVAESAVAAAAAGGVAPVPSWMAR